MGAWNARLFSNDTTCDVRDTYKDCLIQQLGDEDAYKKTCEEYAELIGTDEEPLFWYALADTQWHVGRLMPEVKEMALKFISENGGIDEWEEIPKGAEKWKSTLQRLKDTITSDMPAKKRFAKPVEFIHNPWNTGDVYAYQFHSKEAVEHNLFEKYILIQKVGNSTNHFDDICSVIQVFDKVFTEIPDINELNGIRLLPLSPAPTESHPIEAYVPSFESCLQSAIVRYTKNQYPKKYLTFVGNIKTQEKDYPHSINDFYWSVLEDLLILYYSEWQGVEY